MDDNGLFVGVFDNKRDAKRGAATLKNPPDLIPTEIKPPNENVAAHAYERFNRRLTKLIEEL